MDLYSRAGAAAEGRARELLERLAGEEKAHLKVLAALMDRLHAPPGTRSGAQPAETL
jgi:rubrerythrin